MNATTTEKKLNKYIIAVSIVIPIAVAILSGIKLKDFGIQVEPLSFLPPIYATINAFTAVLLISSLIAIKQGKRKIHETLNKIALLCSVLFLLMYVAYHMTADSTPYGGEGFIRTVYFFILISHILLSIVVIPFVLFTYVKALDKNFEAHKKLARYTFPLWLYVAITGVIVYWMISPYYA